MPKKKPKARKTQPHTPPAEGKKPERILHLSMGSIFVVIFILAFFAVTLFLIFHSPAQPIDSDFVVVNGQQFRFRSVVSDCVGVPIDGQIVKELSKANRAIVMFDPVGPMEYGLTVYELVRITSYSRIPTTVAYSSTGDGKAVVVSLSDGTPTVPIISLEFGDATEVTRAANGQYRVVGADQKGLDAAACQLGLKLFTELYNLKLRT
ncbi:MAG: hypothetical protein ABH829_03050 [archaeon]